MESKSTTDNNRIAVSLIASEVARFISSPDPEVICIKGRWGVGKTFAWSSFYRHAQNSNRISYEFYSYVTLFGRNSLSELRSAIVESSVSTKDINARPDLSSFDNIISFVQQQAGRASIWGRILPQTNNYVDGVQRLLFLRLNKQIVCLDDLERAGAGLNIKDVLGLVSQLKEEKSCKVVILLNDEELKDQTGDFQTQLEKVVDVVFTFDPTPAEAADIAIDKSKPFHDDLFKNCVKLGIVNIRVIKKAERFCSQLASFLEGFDDRIVHQAIHTTTLASYSRFQPDIAPPLDFLKNFDPWERAIKDVHNDKAEPSPHFSILDKYGITSIDEFDLAVIAGVERGFFDREAILHIAKSIQSNLDVSDRRESYHNAWKLYHGSLDDNEAEVIAALELAFKNSMEVMDAANLDNVVSVMNELGKDERAKALIKFYVENRQGDKDFWDIEQHAYRTLSGQFRNQDVVSAFNEKYASFQEIVDPADILNSIGERESWNAKDDANVALLSPADFVAILKEAKGERLKSIVRGMKVYRSISNPSSDIENIKNNIKAALEQISAERRFSAMRIRSWFYNE